MIKTGICDDKKRSLTLLEGTISECLKELETAAEIFTYDSGKDLLKDYEQLDLIFLDIEMPEMDGIETGKIIREKGYAGKIIMASANTEKFKEAFTIDTFRFVSKPFQKEEVMEALKDYIETRLGTEEIKVHRKRNEFVFYQKEILYVYAVNSSIELCMRNGIYRMEGSLSELEGILDPRLFYKISKQYIVNLKEISKYQDEKVTIQGTELKVSVRRKKDFEKAYQMFQIKYS